MPACRRCGFSIHDLDWPDSRQCPRCHGDPHSEPPAPVAPQDAAIPAPSLPPPPALPVARMVVTKAKCQGCGSALSLDAPHEVGEAVICGHCGATIILADPNDRIRPVERFFLFLLTLGNPPLAFAWALGIYQCTGQALTRRRREAASYARGSMITSFLYIVIYIVLFR